jgi:hypothetical protein
MLKTGTSLGIDSPFNWMSRKISGTPFAAVESGGDSDRQDAGTLPAVRPRDIANL